MSDTAADSVPAPVPDTVPAQQVSDVSPVPVPAPAAAEDAAEDAAAPADSAPEGDKPEGEQITYSDFNIPEGMKVNQEILSEFRELCSKYQFSQDQAQSFLDLKVKEAQQQMEAHRLQMETWAAETKNHPEFGGANFQQNLTLAQSAIKVFGDSEFVEFLDQTGLTNHPKMFAVMARIGKAMLEDGRPPPASPAKADPLLSLYPTMRK